MTDIRRPRRGSLAVRPRKRANSIVYRFDYWQGEKDILGFIGYKVGMVSLSYKTTINKALVTEITSGTVLEVPPIRVYGVRYYLKNDKAMDFITDNQEMLKDLSIKKVRANKDLKVEDVKDVRLLVYSKPSEIGGVEINHIIRLELGIGGNAKNKIEKAKNYLGKVISFKDMFKVGDIVDVGAVTKGKGWQGEIKRFGVAKQRRKATGKVRHIGTLGPWHPHYVMYYVPRAGQTGFHNRVELNKQILLIDSKNLPGKFDNYGLVKTDYVILHGSIPGPVKRPVSIRLGVRQRQTREMKDLKVIL